MKEKPSSITISENVTYANMTRNHKTDILKNMTAMESNKESSNQQIFALNFCWGILLGVTGFPTIDMINQIIMQRVSDYEKETSYGIKELFAPVGYTVETFLTAAMVDLYKSNPFLSKYTAIFFCGTSLTVLVCISVYFIKTRTANSKTSKKTSMRFLYKTLLQNLTELKMIMSLLTLFILRVGYNLVNGYLVLFLEKELYTPKTVIGLILVMSSICQIVVFLFSPQLTKMLGGAYSCFLLALISYFATSLLFSFIKSYWLALPIQLFESTGFALFWAAAVEFVHKHASKDV